MDTTQLDQNIRAAEAAAQNIRNQAEAIVVDVAKALGDYGPDVARRYVEAHITRKPDVAKTLGRDGLTQLKGELGKFSAQLPVVSGKIVSAMPWPHRTPPTELNVMHWGSTAGYDGGKLIDSAVQKVFGPLVELLHKHGFEEKRDSRFYLDTAKDADANLHQTFKTLKEKYVNTAIILGDAEERLLRDRKAKASAEAKDLWDQL